MAIFEDISSTHQKYKEDTNLFTTWLANTAKACGWKPSRKAEQEQEQKPAPPTQNKAPRLKGKARKEAKAATANKPNEQLPEPPTKQVKYVVTTQELLKQVDLVANAPGTANSMPGGVRKALQAAISARERCAVWFERTKLGTQTSRDGHRHFIDLLQKALNALGAASTRPAEENKQTKDPENDLAYMRNAFAALDVQDILSDSEDLESSTTNIQPAASRRPDTTKQVYELEVDRQTELAFMVFSFFEDVHRLRADVKTIWARFRDGDLHLLHATVLTTAALELVRRMEQDAHSALLALNKKPAGTSLTTYRDLVATIYNAESLGRAGEPGLVTNTISIEVVNTRNPTKHVGPKPDYTEPPPSLEALEIKPFDEFVFLPAGRTLTRLAEMRTPVLKFEWPMLVPPMALNYVSRPELLEDPRIQYFERQDRFIINVFQDMVLDDTIRHPETHHSGKMTAEIQEMMRDTVLDFDDAVYSAFRQLWATGAVTMATVFAAQISWDIHELGQKNQPVSKIMKQASKDYKDSFGFIVSAQGALDTRDVRWLTKDSELLMKLYGRVHIHMQMETFSMYKQIKLENWHEPPEVPAELQASLEASRRAQGWIPPSSEIEENAKRIGKQRLGMVKPSPDHAFLVEANKLHAGTLLLDVASMAEEAGIHLANHHLSIFCMAHLYNAAHKLGVFDVHWPEMDRIIDIHAGPIFADDIPKKPSEIFSRFAYRIGMSTTNSRRFNQKMPWKLTTTATTQALRAFFSSRTSLPRLLNDLSSQAATHDKTVGGAGGAKSSKVPGRRLQLTPRNTLAKMEQYMDAVMPDINIKYVPLTRRCNAFFKRLRTQLQSRTGIDFPTFTDPGESNDRGPLAMALSIFNEARDIEDSLKKRRTPDAENPYLQAEQLMIFRDMLEKELRGHRS